MLIAIDGPAASGKGTLATRLAAFYNLPHLDTGLLYRATARALLDAGHALEDARAAEQIAYDLNPATFNELWLRGREMGEAASIVATIPGVRTALLDVQRRFAVDSRGAVLDGRDIGTVVCPQAHVKLFVTATPEERARRRHRELIGRGENPSYDNILLDVLKRDARDSSRATAPLIAAPDAHVIDTTTLNADAVLETAKAIVESVTGQV